MIITMPIHNTPTHRKGWKDTRAGRYTGLPCLENSDMTEVSVCVTSRLHALMVMDNLIHEPVHTNRKVHTKDPLNMKLCQVETPELFLVLFFAFPHVNRVAP